MRTLKKTLCVVLCLAMMVGLCAIGASAIKYDDYKDKDAITYEGAVKLLTALGVLEGDEKGFRPTDELNRAEGAAIMTRLLGRDVPEGTSSFTDMAGYGWAQKYVKFCEDYGIIAGYGDGKFGPGDKLTTSQFAKMLITALGYDAKKEGFVDNAAWEINVTKKVTALNLADGMVYLPGKNILREQAAQLAYNTLLQPMVYAEGSSIAVSWVGDLMVGGDAILTVRDGSLIPNTSYDYNTNNPIDNVLEFCEAVYPELKLRTGDDVYGIPTNYWFMGKNAQDKAYSAAKVICSTIAVPVVATYGADLMTITGKGLLYTYGDYAWEAKENGQNALAHLREVYTKYWDAPLGAYYGGAEIIVLDVSELYDLDGSDWVDVFYPGDTTKATAEGLYRFIIKYPYLAQVAAVTGGEERTVTLKVYQNVDKPIMVSYETEDFKKGDYVLVYDWGTIVNTKAYEADDFEDEIIEVLPAESKNGTLTTVTLDSSNATGLATSLTVGGSALPIGCPDLANLGPQPGTGYGVRAPKIQWTINTGLTAYMSNGFVLGVVPDSVAYGEWVFVIGHDDHGVGSPLTPALETFVVGYVDQTAKYFETKSTVLKGETPDINYWTPVDEGALESYDEDYVYNVNKDCELTEGLKHDQPELGLDADGNKIIADSKTVFVLRTGLATFKAYTGIHNVPDYTVKDGGVAPTAYALVPSEGAHAVAVYVDVRGMDGVDEEADPIYVLGLYPGKKTDDDGTVVYTYLAIVDGEIKEVMTKNPMAELEEEGLVVPHYKGKYIDYVTKLDSNPAYLMIDAKGVTCTFENDTVTFGDPEEGTDKTYAVAFDAVAYVYKRGTDKVIKTTVDVLPGLPAGDVTCIATAKDKTIHTIYYIYPSKAAAK